MGKKLTSENGETLTELLISVLVIALGLSMFAAALTASRKMLILGTEKIETYYSERNGLEGEKKRKGSRGNPDCRGNRRKTGRYWFAVRRERNRNIPGETLSCGYRFEKDLEVCQIAYEKK